ncbi:DUF983 domain-containing protein [Mucilaginibacter psychrotolerans]|uniref:DUF983 domain-containing protein n=1 Tax=Mucilaginibacter psychrotolerans TaxID=1524096 RepID=A0A4Y8SA35_9SPHI|nr:DUF983 domain-containing protein [Mucilaginibacter psychrotolerans]TFF35490.1 DUF983 domain-containing protein [Mucilaginibacter psychrotolerans]
MESQKFKIAVWPSFLHAKCPRCRRGRIFANSMYGFGGQKMNATCDHCHLTYEIEPGYFYVAMFVSYAMNVAEFITAVVAISVLTGSNNPWLYVIVVLAISVILSPFNFRYSRVILLYWLTPGLHYNPELSKDKPFNQ